MSARHFKPHIIIITKQKRNHWPSTPQFTYLPFAFYALWHLRTSLHWMLGSVEENRMPVDDRGEDEEEEAVSYTHLTLPTKCCV